MSTGNFRPLPVLPFLSKLLERIVYNRLTHNILTASVWIQAEKIPGTALLSFTYDIFKAFDNEQHTATIFLELAKALDIVDLSHSHSLDLPRSLSFPLALPLPFSLSCSPSPFFSLLFSLSLFLSCSPSPFLSPG